jgi:hypothetical protein
MQNNNLPKTFEGFSTEELLGLLNKRLAHQSLEGTPQKKLIAVSKLARTYRLTPVHRHSPKM